MQEYPRVAASRGCRQIYSLTPSEDCRGNFIMRYPIFWAKKIVFNVAPLLYIESEDISYGFIYLENKCGIDKWGNMNYLRATK